MNGFRTQRYETAQAGFTLVEVIAALVLMAIVAAVLVARNSGNTMHLQTERDTLEKHLRAAQMRSMQGGGIQVTQGGTVGQVYGIKSDGQNYWMFAGTNPDAAGAVVPLLDDPSVTLASGKLSLAAKKVTLDQFTVYFAGYGVPCSAYTDESIINNIPNYTAQTQTLTVTMTGDNSSRTVSVTPYTGFIQ